MSKREENKAQIRQRIKDACIGLLGQKSFQDMTIKDVCDAANIARKTLYSYFSSKEELLDEISQEVMFESSISSFRDVIEEFESTEQRLDTAFLRVGEPMLEYQGEEAFAVFIQLIQNLTLRISANSEQLTAFHDAAFEFFQACFEQGDCKPDLNARVIADLTVDALVGIIISWVNDQHYPAQERIENLKKHIASVILA